MDSCEAEQEYKPQWLLELENRKRKQKLAHETGAGAPCLTCKSGCPGLDLHFWRKICKNCKCRGDDHDFDEDEFPQFHLLFGTNVKDKKHLFVLHLKDKKSSQSETTFEWIPANTTKELAVDYMKALPIEKLPIKGSVGAAFRRQQLQKQLPLHDIDHKVCDKLSEEEQEAFEKYLDNLKNCAGQGKVSKLMSIRPFDRSLMTPANATDVQRFSPQYSQQLLQPNIGLNLRTPSSFISKVPHLLNNNVAPLSSSRDINAQHFQMEHESNQIGKYHHALSSIHNDNSASLSSDTIVVETERPQNATEIEPGRQYCDSLNSLENGTCLLPSNIDVIRTQNLKATNEINARSAQYHHSSLELPNNEKCSSSNLSAAQAQHSQALDKVNSQIGQHHPSSTSPFNNNSVLLPFKTESIHTEHLKSRNAVNLQQGRYYHTLEKVSSGGNVANAASLTGVYHSEGGQLKNSNTQNNQSLTNTSHPFELKYSKTPIFNVTEESVHNGAIHKANKPLINKQKSKSESCYEEIENHFELPSDLPSNILLAEQMLSEALLPPSAINSTDIVSSSLDKKELMYIRDKLNDKYSNKSDFQVPSASREIAKASKDHSSQINEFNRTLLPSQSPCITHSEHIQAKLSTSLPVQTNVIHSEVLNNPVFPEDPVGTSIALQNPQNVSQLQEEMGGMNINVIKMQKCHKCEENIYCGDVVVTAEKIKDAVWHPGCFVCSACNELLVDLVYFIYKGKLYCGRDLARFLDIPRCFACDELIFVREYTVAEGHNYHVKHFCCWDCDIPLAGQQYISENDRPLCLPCYQKNYAKTCNACNSVIAADQQGVAIKNLNFHASDKCFRCVMCKKTLLGGQIAIKENKLLCSKDCIAEFLRKN